MTKQLLVLGCSQTKLETKGYLPAIERYDGSSYRVLRRFLREREWPRNLSVAVLSAKYGLVGGFTGIENYDERMTPEKAKMWAPRCNDILGEWANCHASIHFSLGKDYLPAVRSAIDRAVTKKIEVFKGPIGEKLQQIKNFLHTTASEPRKQRMLHDIRQGRLTYFLPDWDDLLDEDFDFNKDQFSASTRAERGDKHCTILMKPSRMCDGVLVSLAQHVTSKGPLRRILGTENESLAPKDLRQQFGLESDQTLFGDCGAFSYVNESKPSISVEQAVALYDLHGFDFGASVDHIPVEKIVKNGVLTELTESQKRGRIEITKLNAAKFIELANKRRVNFNPVGTVQALSPQGYAKTVRFYHELGYRYIALGGLVPQSDSAIEKIVRSVMDVTGKLNPRPWIHLFGIFRPRLQELFRTLKVDSFDSATYFRKAWLRSDQNYLAPNGNWYAAIRVPMTSDPRTGKKLETSKLDITVLEAQESEVLRLLRLYDEEKVKMAEVLDAVIEYDEKLIRASEISSLREKYIKTLTDRPWKACKCTFCKRLGIQMLIFRGANRNKRRGAHNTLMLYQTLK